jgi:hypothetical protein
MSLPSRPRRPALSAFRMVGSGWQTDETALAAALLTVGIPLLPDKPFNRYEGDDSRVVFFFAESSPCGKFRTEELVAAWADLDTWNRQFPDHPFSYAAGAVKNLRHLVTFIKRGTAQVVMKHGDKFAVIRADAPTAEADKIISRLYDK